MTINPIFIIGNPRSGTTLLRLILNAHSNIVIPPEAGFAMWLYSKYNNFTLDQIHDFIVDMKQTKKIGNWTIDWEALHKHIINDNPENYQQLINSVYYYYGQSLGKNAKRWGDKNNFYLNRIREIKHLFPNASIVHIVRDGRNVACSYKALNKKNITSKDAPALPNSIEVIAEQWSENMKLINDSFKSINYDGVIQVRLEDITNEPIREIERITKFIGEDFEPKMLEYYKSENHLEGEPKEYLQWKEKNTKPILNEAPNKFKNELTKKEIQRFNAIAQKALVQYGYIR